MKGLAPVLKIACWSVPVMLCGCDSGNFDDRGTTVIREVRYRADRSPAIVLFGSRDAPTCAAVARRSEEVRKSRDAARKASNGLDFVDGPGYRAYFSLFPPDPARISFVFCNGEGSPYISNRCILIGRSPAGCFQTEIVSVDALPGLVERLQGEVDKATPAKR